MLSIRQKQLLGVLITALFIRLISLHFYPLMDTTEARYGEMARLMVETGNWLTPLFDYGVPFWGKPPLQNWMSAGSIALFTNNEFFLRLPHFIAGLFTLIAVALFAKQFAISRLNVALVLSTICVFYVCLGTVMTDMGLLLAVTLAYIGFYLAFTKHKSFAYIGFIGLGIGLLAKGPVALVIFFIGSGLWLLWHFGAVKMWSQLVLKVPLISGFALMLLLAAPWYWMAEQATPGFLEYFLIGEHYSRFVDSGWQGDLYGSAHDQPRGKIWLFFAFAGLPWTLFIPAALYKLYQRHNGFDGLTKFLICWMLSPLILFTLAGNILPAYVLPAAPALALLVAYAWKEHGVAHLAKVAAFIPVLLLVALAMVNSGIDKQKSDKWLLSQRSEDHRVFYWLQQEFSGRYYTQGQAKLIDQNTLQEVTQSQFYLVAHHKHIDVSLPPFSRCIQQANTQDKSLLLCRSSASTSAYELKAKSDDLAVEQLSRH
ncbi:glycosyltransferase family 39 protein [Shewanella sp. WXL01]|uniref:ArnT family glycosyltransferase n=1 Tax=Shewanella sp. WXL01 TaxID=2709721 RepID=UPI0014384E6C|nr:glycosyltransferase family 39 protein [Shewanella sp. WXL01]NKF50490.1 glycosyltransferase family 39 protein [Shewanella sp. WXL01]